MSLRLNTPCDCDGFCPYDAEYFSSCEWFCGADEPEDYPPEDWEEEDCDDEYYEEDSIEMGFNPYIGGYDYDC